MNKLVLGIFLLSTVIFIGSCSNELDLKDYKMWLKDGSNGLHKIKQEGPLTFDAQYKPIEFIAAQEAKGNRELFAKQLKEHDGIEYIDLSISSKEGDLIKSGASSSEQVYDKLYYFNFRFQDDIKLKVGDKEYPCSIYHFERSYDLAKEKRFLLGFTKSGGKEDRTLIIDGQSLGGAIVKIKFEKKDLESIPQVKL